MSVSDFFRDLFSDEEASGDDLAAIRLKAGEAIMAERTAFVERLMEYLQEEADRPIKLGDTNTMLESAVRANTFKEIRAKLRREFKEAHAVLNEAKDAHSRPG